MRNNVMLSVQGVQRYGNEAPEQIELVTEGRIWREKDALHLSYQESELTGLSGTQTEFVITAEQITLERTGALKSKMVFELGKTHKSLYDAGVGGLLITICTTAIENHLEDDGGNLRVTYTIEIEDMGMGEIEYYIVATKL